MNVDHTNAAGVLEEVVLTWTAAYEEEHPGHPLDRSEVLGQFLIYVKRIRVDAGNGPADKVMASVRDPSTWPMIDGESDHVRHLMAICVALAKHNGGGQFFITSRTLADERTVCGHKIGQTHALTIIHRAVELRLITPTGKKTYTSSPYYTLGPWHGC